MKHNCPKNTVKLRPLAVTGARFVVSFAVLAGALALTACATGDVPTPEEIKQDNTESRARQLVRVGDASRAGGDALLRHDGLQLRHLVRGGVGVGVRGGVRG